LSNSETGGKTSSYLVINYRLQIGFRRWRRVHFNMSPRYNESMMCNIPDLFDLSKTLTPQDSKIRHGTSVLADSALAPRVRVVLTSRNLSPLEKYY